MSSRMIAILPVGTIDPEVLNGISAVLARRFECGCEICEALDHPAYAFTPKRRQYYSTAILRRVKEAAPRSRWRALGVTALDIFVPVLTFVFGEAQMNGENALISICRLRQEFYGLPRDERLLRSRAEKEAIHEIGHTLGLVHCRDYSCVMHASYSVEDTDIKLSSLCSLCEGRLQRMIHGFPGETDS
jgi:archaemetzincin